MVIDEGYLSMDLFHPFHTDVITYLTFQNSDHSGSLGDNGLEGLAYSDAELGI